MKMEEPFRIWVKENARLISARWPDVLRHGLFIVTSTFATEHARLSIIHHSGQKMTAGLKGGIPGIGKGDFPTSWVTANTDSGWVGSVANKEGKSSTSNLAEPLQLIYLGSKQVVFMSGLFFRWPVGFMPVQYQRILINCKLLTCSRDMCKLCHRRSGPDTSEAP